MTAENTSEWYRAVRPKLLKGMVGQSAVVQQMKSLLRSPKTIPHALLFAGPSGTGKTTLARIVARKLKASAEETIEYNCAGESRGIDFIRQITQRTRTSTLDGGPRVMIFDECHQITSDAQDAALKLTEDVPAHCYLIFCSSEPDKLKTAFRSRLSSYVLQSITADDLEQLARTTAAKFGAAFSDEVIEACVNSSKGSARRLLVSLQQLTTLSNDNDRLAFLELTDSREASESLAKLLVSGASWAKVAAALRASEDEPEKLRRGILAYSSAILLNQPTDNAFRRRMVTIMEAMQFDLYASGKPGLVLACFNLCQS